MTTNTNAKENVSFNIFHVLQRNKTNDYNYIISGIN